MKYILTFILAITSLISYSQVIDTIANWDGINVEWTIWAESGQVATNPFPDDINPSEYCYEITTSDGPYDLMYTEFAQPVNFEEFPYYRLKIFAPESGGSILLKFENEDVSAWDEIERVPEPGQWDDLFFDFSGVTATDYSRLVVFFDFQGTNAGIQWYIDDVLRASDGTPGLTTNLPIVIINTYGQEIPDEPKITAHMGIIDHGYGNLNNEFDPPNDYNGYVGIEIRGQSTQMFPKKSYGFETRDEEGNNLNVPLMGLPEENDWILYAPYSDKSMLRNFISFWMGSKLDPYCSRMVYCEVIINNDYKGVYILMERIKKDPNRVDIATLNPGDISGDELTGGYIVRVDKIDPDFIYGEDGWLSDPSPGYPNAMDITFQYFYPKPEDLAVEQSDYIKEYITEAEAALIDIDFNNPDVGYNNYFNTGSFIDQMILCEVSKEVDKYRYSTYFFKEKDSDGGELFAGPAWDFNLGYSNVDYWPPGNEYSGWIYPNVEPHEWSIIYWWKRLMEDNHFRDLLKTRWHQLRQDKLSNAQFEYVIDSVVGYIYDAQERNYERWPILGEYVWPNYDWWGNDYNDEVDFLENWLYNRLNWMDENISGNILNPEAVLSGTFPVFDIYLFDDYLNNPFFETEDILLNLDSEVVYIDSIEYINAAQAKVHMGGILEEPVNISFTLRHKILNSFIDLTTNNLSVGDVDLPQTDPFIWIGSSSNMLILKCNQPDQLEGSIILLNHLGQKVLTIDVDAQAVNHYNLDLPSGIYICAFNFKGELYTNQVFIQ